jgi:hypothetical protein
MKNSIESDALFLEALKAELKYDPETGCFFWLKRKQGRKQGWFIGNEVEDGYCQVHFQGKNLMAHRAAWFFCYGKFPDQILDNINRNPSDNRISNLREATYAENQQNTTKKSNNKSGFKGVSWAKANKKWRAIIVVNKKRFNLGYFTTPELASEAYEKKAKELHTHHVVENPDVFVVDLEKLNAIIKPSTKEVIVNTEDEEFQRIEQEIKRIGRPLMNPADKKQMAAVSLSIAQKEKLRELGGSAWLQKQIDKAKIAKLS